MLKPDDNNQYGQTIKSFALPYILKNESGHIHTTTPKTQSKIGKIDIVPGDFWLNTFSDILNVGTEVLGGSGLYRFLLPSLLHKEIEKQKRIEYDYVLIDLPPSFNTLVRSALYCSDYFLVPCTADFFSSYCIGLIGEMLPKFLSDWKQGTERYLRDDPSDIFIPSKGKPKFGGWIFNGFDTRKKFGEKQQVAADRVHYDKIMETIEKSMFPNLNQYSNYEIIPQFIQNNAKPIGEIEDLNVMAPDSIIQNIPICYLSDSKPTNSIRGRGSWASNQVDLMKCMADEYDKMAQYINTNFI